MLKPEELADILRLYKFSQMHANLDLAEKVEGTYISI